MKIILLTLLFLFLFSCSNNDGICSGVKCIDNATCSSEDGICYCDNGFYRDGENCIEDINDLCLNITCQDNATCSSSDGICYCDTGFYKDGDNCIEDINDLCLNITCQDNATCSSSDGICYCDTGFYKDGEICIEDSGNLTVHFYKPTSWGNSIKIYYWNSQPESSVSWPGVDMIDEGDNWYIYNFSNITSTNLIFNDTTNQTADLTRDKNGWYKDNQWYDSKPSDNPNQDNAPPEITASISSGIYADPISVYYTITDNKPEVTTAYYTTDGTTPTEESSQYISGDATSPLQGQVLNITQNTTVKFLIKDFVGNITRTNFYYTIGEVPQTGDFREETIYFLLTARFYDGDESNNYYNRDRIKFDENGDPIDPQWRGDFKGLISKLDYIKDLGFTAIWITPPVENRSGLDYHGYHAYDWTKIDPRLESTDATYQDLINEAHSRGIKIIQDVVVNHSSQYGIRNKVWIDKLPIKYYRPQGWDAINNPISHGPYQGNLGDYKTEFREDNDNPLAPLWFKERQTSDPNGTTPLIDPLTNTTLPLAGYNPNRFFGIDANNLNATWYHQDGFIAGGDWENPNSLQTKHIAGDCIDLNTENSTVQDYLNNAIISYLDMGVDAIRVDTVKHLKRENLVNDFVNVWKAHKPSLFVFGENLVKGTGWGSENDGSDNGPASIRPWWYTRLGLDPSNPNSGGDSGFSVLDFSLMSTFRDNIQNGNYGGIGGVLSHDWFYGDATKLVTFFQNHDIGPDNDWKYRFSGEQWKAAGVYNMLWTIRGIPCLYYGEEIEFKKGATQDIIEANDTLDMTGRAYYGDFLETDTISQTQSNPLYQHIKRLNQIRKSIPALQKGEMSNVNEFGSGMSFVRDYNNGESYVTVGLAIGPGDYEEKITINGVRNGQYIDAVTGHTIKVTNNIISFSVKNNSIGVYVLNGKDKIGKAGKYLR